MLTLAAIFGLYGTIVASIYAVSTRLKDVLKPDYAKMLGEQVSRTQLSSLIQNAFVLSVATLDRMIGFRQRRNVFLPNIANTFCVTVGGIIVVSTWLEITGHSRSGVQLPGPFEMYLIQVLTNAGLLNFDRPGIFEFAFVVLTTPATFFLPHTFAAAALIGAHTLIVGTLSDYCSFIKTRTLLSFSSARGLMTQIVMVVIDLTLSFVLAIALSVSVMHVLDLWLPWADRLANQYYQAHFDHPVPTYYFQDSLNYNPILFAIAVGFFSFLTSLGIFFIGACCVLIIWTMRLIWMIDRIKLRLVPLLDFEKNPVQSAGLVVIALFTLIYIPVSIFLVFI